MNKQETLKHFAWWIVEEVLYSEYPFLVDGQRPTAAVRQMINDKMEKKNITYKNFHDQIKIACLEYCNQQVCDEFAGFHIDHSIEYYKRLIQYLKSLKTLL